MHYGQGGEIKFNDICFVMYLQKLTMNWFDPEVWKIRPL